MVFKTFLNQGTLGTLFHVTLLIKLLVRFTRLNKPLNNVIFHIVDQSTLDEITMIVPLK